MGSPRPKRDGFRILHGAELFLDSCTADQCRQIIDAIVLLRRDPGVDGVSKFPFDAPPMVLTLYREEAYWILYRDDGPLLRVYNIGRVGRDRPGLPSY